MATGTGSPIPPSMMKKHSFESAVKKKYCIQFLCCRYLGKSLVVASLVREDMSQGEMTVRRIRVEGNGPLSFSDGTLPVPIVPDKTE